MLCVTDKEFMQHHLSFYTHCFFGLLTKIHVTVMIFHIDCMVTATDTSKCLSEVKNNSGCYECGLLGYVAV